MLTYRRCQERLPGKEVKRKKGVRVGYLRGGGERDCQTWLSRSIYVPNTASFSLRATYLLYWKKVIVLLGHMILSTGCSKGPDEGGETVWDTRKGTLNPAFCTCGRNSKKVFMKIFEYECKPPLRILLKFLAGRNIKMLHVLFCLLSWSFEKDYRFREKNWPTLQTTVIH